MKKKTDRNSRFKPWRTLIPFTVPPEAAMSGVVAAFQNHLLTIFVKETDSPAFSDPHGNPSKIAHLIIHWSDTNHKGEIPYKFLQKAKSELCGEQSDAVQLYPAAWREDDLKQTHLWALPQGASFPIGLVPLDLQKKMAEAVGGRENLITEEDMQVRVLTHADGIIEVFADEKEREEAYGENPVPDGTVAADKLIGEVPMESPLVGWTAKAKTKASELMAKAKRAAPAAKVQEAPQLFYDNDNPRFEGTVYSELEDELEGEMDSDDDPVGVEEHLALEGAMRIAMANKGEERVKALRAVTKEALGDGDIVSLNDTTSKIITP